jgi:hypothetical protein
MTRRVVIAWKLIRFMGMGWCLFRVWYRLQSEIGWLAFRTPPFEWSERPLATWLSTGVPSDPAAYREWRRGSGGTFFFSALPAPTDLDGLGDRASVIREADDVVAGQWRYFYHALMPVGCPPDWHRNPATGERAPRDRHWSRISDFGFGDIKFVWEASRFSVVFVLARAYARTRHEMYPRVFWLLVEDWAAANPPQRGVNWKCGQEAAVRVMAWCFGLYAFAASPETTPVREARLVSMIAAHAERIERNLAYAWSQKNNHGITEAVGLWTVGLLFSDLTRSATWKRLGRRLLEREVERQIYPDGSYVQHSFNYHRVMLDALVWALRLGEVNGDRLSQPVYDSAARASAFLEGALDPVTGEAPQTGSNDGALLLPLSGCDGANFRPAVQASAIVARGGRVFAPGAWDECALWLCGPSAEAAPVVGPATAPLEAPYGGYYVLRAPDAWAMVRCARYKDRPGHSEQLHVDLWHRGLNIACDAGTYRYNADAPWNNGLMAAAVHNTVTIDGQDQMVTASRFLSVDWSVGRVIDSDVQQEWQFWSGEHSGYARLGVTHRRSILFDGRTCWIFDELLGAGKHDFRLHWLLCDGAYRWQADRDWARLELDTRHGTWTVEVTCDHPAQYSLIRAGAGTRGWRSRYYGAREAALSLVAEGSGGLPAFVCTRLAGPVAAGSDAPPAALMGRLHEWHRAQVVTAVRG